MLSIRRWDVQVPFEMDMKKKYEEQAREAYVEGLEKIIERIRQKNEDGVYVYLPPGEIRVRAETNGFNQTFVFHCVFDRNEEWMTSKMQYLVSLSDETVEKVVELERLRGVERDEIIAFAIAYLYESYTDSSRRNFAGLKEWIEKNWEKE